MYNYRVTKYNPAYRNEEGFFTKNEWTSLYDIGKEYEGKVFTLDEYINVESFYIEALKIFMNASKNTSLTVKSLEKVSKELVIDKNKQIYSNEMINLYDTVKENDVLHDEQIHNLCRLILREHLWCLLQGNNFQIEFGYDYYMYIMSKSKEKQIINKVTRIGLFIEEVQY